MGVAGIVLSLLLLIYLAYCGVSVLLLAPLCAILAVMLDGNLPLLATYTQIFMGSVGEFIKNFFPLFLLGALFGKLIEDSGSAAKIANIVIKALGAQRTVLAIVVTCSILTYGGVSLFVVVFAIFPLARSLFRQADLPRRLIPGTIALGSFTYTMTALPGSVQIQNQIPMPFFRTNAFAAPGLGCIGAAVMFVLGMLWLNARVSGARNRGEGFGPAVAGEEHTTDTDAVHRQAGDGSAADGSELPAAWSAFLPIFCAIGLNFLFAHYLIPSWDTDYLAEERFGGTQLSKVLGMWATILSLLITLLITIALHFRSLRNLNRSLAVGANSSLTPLFNTACEFGYGNTIKALAGFTVVKEFVMGVAPANPLISQALSVNSLAAMTGSASGGLSIALQALGETYYERGIAAGINPELLHRVASMSCGGLDSLPHNGAVITLLLICGVTHRQGYLDIGVVTVLCPLAGTLTVLALGTAMGSF
jgi:H+/gluconate symporter-like permease